MTENFKEAIEKDAEQKKEGGNGHDLDSKLDAMQQSFNSKMDQLAETTANVITKVVTQPVQPPPQPEDDLETEEHFTPEQHKIIEKMVGSAVKKAKTEALTEINQQNTQQAWDKRAEAEFPELKDKSSPFYKEVVAEFRSSPSMNAPDAVYNAASRVFTKWARDGKVKSLNTEVRNLNIKTGFTESATPGQRQIGNKPDLSEEETYIAKKLGMDPKKYQQLRKAPITN